jgi:CRP-like cAMP-binding protein
LPDDSPLRNRLLASLPPDSYTEAALDLDLMAVAVGDVVVDDAARMQHVFFPNGGVYSVTAEMLNGDLVEVATVGLEGMLGVNAFLGDLQGSGRSLQQVPDGLLPRMRVRDFLKHTAQSGPFRDVIMRYAQANFLQVMQSTACNALHNVEQRCCRWLLQTHDRVDGDSFLLKQEFLAIMLGASRPTVNRVVGGLQEAGLIRTRYGRIQIVDRKKLERSSCECYRVVVDHFKRLGL